MRLQRIGRKNSPSYRVVIVDSRQGPKSGKFVDMIGFYDPKAGTRRIDGVKAAAWIGKGAQVSPTVHNMLITEKMIEGKKIMGVPAKKEVVEAEAAPEAPKAEVAEEVAAA